MSKRFRWWACPSSRKGMTQVNLQHLGAYAYFSVPNDDVDNRHMMAIHLLDLRAIVRDFRKSTFGKSTKPLHT